MLLAFGSKGPEVQQLQGFMNLLPTKQPILKMDGIFGTKTRSRVFEFQIGNHLVPDGIVGPATFETLIRILKQLGLLPDPVPPAPTPTVTRPINQQILGMSGSSNLIQQIIPAKPLIDVASFKPGDKANQLRFTVAPLTTGRLGIFAAGKGGDERAVILLLPATGVPQRTLIGITHTFGQGRKGLKLMESLGWSNPLSAPLIQFTLLKHVINRWGALTLASKKPMAYVQIVRARGTKGNQLGPFRADGAFMKQVLSEMATLTAGAFGFGTVETFTFSSGIHEHNPFVQAISTHLNVAATYNIDPAKATPALRLPNILRRQFLSGQTGGPAPGFEFLPIQRWKNEDLFHTPLGKDHFNYLHNHCMPQYILHLGIQTS